MKHIFHGSVPVQLHFSRTETIRSIRSIILIVAGALHLSTTTTSAAPLQTCSGECRTVVDFEHATGHLFFSRHQPVSMLTPIQKSGSTGQNWRHNFEIVLTKKGKQRVVFDQWGNKHVFSPTPSGDYKAQHSDSGRLNQNSSQHYLWTDQYNTQHLFKNSYPASIQYTGGNKLHLSYTNGLLSNVEDEPGNRLHLEYRNNKLVALTWPDGTVHPLNPPGDPATPECDEPEQCDTQSNPPAGFHSGTTPEYATVLDARPGSCRSFFVEYYGTDRGDHVESGLALHPPYSQMTATVHSYPVIDFFNDERLLVVISRDLGAAGFNNPSDPDALLGRLLTDGRNIHRRFLEPLTEHGSISVTELGETTLIEALPERSLTLQLVIRHGMANEDQWAQIHQAREQLIQDYGITLEVLIIP